MTRNTLPQNALPESQGASSASSLSRVVQSAPARTRVSNVRKLHQPATRGELPTALYRIDEAAEFLNVKPKTLRNRISLGEIAVYRVGRGVRISQETLREILDRGYVPARVQLHE